MDTDESSRALYYTKTTHMDPREKGEEEVGLSVVEAGEREAEEKTRFVAPKDSGLQWWIEK
jgi:hypothetical protein